MKKRFAISITIALIMVISMSFAVFAKSYSPSKVKIKSCKISTFDCNTVSIKWGKIKKNVKGYQIYRSSKKKGKYKKVATIKPSVTSLDMYTPEVGKRYYYKIRAYNKKNGKTYYGKWSKVKSIYVKENGPALEAVYANFNFNKGKGFGYIPHYNTDYDSATIVIGNFSKTKTVYINTEDAAIFNHNNSIMKMYIDSYTFDAMNFYPTNENDIITLPPRKTIVLLLKPYSNQTIISFINMKNNVNAIAFSVGYSKNSANNYTYMWDIDKKGCVYSNN